MSSTNFSAPIATLVGRDAELKVLQAALDGLADNRGALVSILGPAGIGKTRLATEIATRAQTGGVAVHWGRAWPGPGAPPFWPWTQVLRSVLAGLREGERDACYQSFSRELGHVLEPSVGRRGRADGTIASEQLHFRVFDAVTSFLGAAAAQRRQLIVLDDLHDADASTLQLLRFLAQALPHLPLAVVATIRDHEARASEQSLAFASLARAGRVVQLPPLTPDHVSVLVAATGAPAAVAFAATLHRISAGVPYYVEAILRQALAERHDGSALDERDLRVSAEAGDAALYAVGRLGEAVLDLLAAAAVVGIEFRGDQVACAQGCSPGEADERLAAASRLGAIESITGRAGWWRFAHAILREALYRRLSEPERALRHERLAHAMIAAAGDGRDGAAEIAAHLLAAAVRGDATDAIEWSLRAAAEAEKRCAYEDSTAWFARARRTAADRRQASLERSALEGFARTQALVGETEAARAAYESLWQDAIERGDAAQQGRVALGLAGPPLLPVGFELPIVRPSSLDRLRAALAALHDGEVGLRAMLRARLAAEICERDGSDERTESLSLEALTEAESGGDARALAYCLALRHVVAWGTVTADERLQLIDRIVELARRLADPDLAARANLWRVSCLFELGDVAAVERELSEWHERRKQQPHPLDAWYLPLFDAGLALLRGAFGQAEEYAHRAMRDGFRLVQLDAAFANGVQQFFLRRELGTLASRRSLVQGLADAHPTSSVIRTMLAFLFAEIGDHRAASEEFERLAIDDFAALRRNTLWLGYTCILSEVCVLLGDRRRAARLFAMLAPHVDDNGIVGAVFLGAVAHYLSRLATVLGRQAEAAEFARRACQRHEAMGAVPCLVRSRLAYADALDAEAAAIESARARELAERIGMPLPSALQKSAIASVAGASSADRSPECARFARRGEGWELEFGGVPILLPRLKGCDHIEVLLRRPGADIDAFELLDAGGEESAYSPTATLSASGLAAAGLRRAGLGDAGPRLDRTARQAYRQRMNELDVELAEAEGDCDLGRVERTRSEIEFLRREVSAAVGLGGRVRREGAAIERARLTVTKRIKAALQKIERHHPPLARFLADSIRTGVVCRYAPPPDRSPTWRFD